LDEALSERTMGRDDAPVTIQEYSSLGCPHCAAFHRDTLPKIKETYIDTGKARLVFNDFPLGNLALAAAMLTRCVDKDKYFGLVELIFRSQATWSRSQRPRDALLKLVRFAGMSEADFDACLGNEPLMKGIRQRAAAAGQKYDIRSTPTFIIGETTVPGNLPFEEFRKIIDQALGTKN
jgi:protein-disulfide isomerase